MPHSPKKPRKNNGWLTTTVGGPVWLEAGGEDKAGRGEPRCCLADFLLCRANADVSCQLPRFSGVSSLLSSHIENSPHTQSCPGELREGTWLSGPSAPGLSEVDLPVSRCPTLWDWPNGQHCPLLTPPFCANCPKQITKLFLEPEQPECTLPSLDGRFCSSFCSSPSSRQCDCLHGLAIGLVLIASEWLVYFVSFGFLPSQTVSGKKKKKKQTKKRNHPWKLLVACPHVMRSAALSRISFLHLTTKRPS